MSNTLFSDLTNKPQRESAGSDSASRFDYQKDWAFCRMMRKHIDGEDYLVAFEYHDDVLFLSPSDAPNAAEFFQVKTSSSQAPRKLTTLTTRPKGKSSILAKMFDNFEGICGSHDVKVVLVSNNAFEFADKEICAKDLDTKFQERLLTKLKEEMPHFDKSRIEKLHFLVTGVSLEAMQSFLEGEAMELFCGRFGEDHGLNIRTWVRLIKGEIARKNNYPSNKIETAEDLIHLKCIGHSLVEKSLEVMHQGTRQPPNIASIGTALTNAGWKVADIMSLEKKITEAHRDYYDPTNLDVQEIVKKIRSSVYNRATGQMLDLAEFLIEAGHRLSNDTSVFTAYRNKGYIWAIGVIVYYDAI